MNIETLPSRIPLRYWGYLALSLWTGAILFLIRPDLYALDEGAAKSLLLLWSIADQVASSVVTFGAPDLRILLFLPIGFLWTGSVFAAKVFTTLAVALTAWLLYAWKRQAGDAESALVATGLLIIAPLMLEHVDMLAPGAYLLLAFALGAWLNNAYRATPRPFGGWYFTQLFICAFSASLHPAGLAYPLALLWSWHKEPLDRKQQKYFFIGIGFVTLFTLLVRMGWHDLEWLQNPIKSLAAITLGSSPNSEAGFPLWLAGGLALMALTLAILKQYRNLWSDFTGRTLLLALALGAATCDSAWALVALAIILYFGLPLALRPLSSVTGGFLHQRGIALLAVVVISALFMRTDRAHYEMRNLGGMTAQDRAIKILTEEAEGARKVAEDSDGARQSPRIRVASQWPSRTMIACKCDTLPLPPAAKDPQAQLAMLRTITHLLFNPQQTDNMMLSRNLAMLGGSVSETIALENGAVLLHLRELDQNAQGAAPNKN